MGIVIDHVFILTSAGAPEAVHLARMFKEGPPNTHPGQGTANRRFFFDNFMLELLWVSNPGEAQSEQTRRTGLYDRWIGRDGGGCPFGVVFRPDSDAMQPPPFPAWEYRPEWLPRPHVVHVAETPFDEPMWFFMDFLRPSRNGDPYGDHRNSMGAMTGLVLTTRRPMSSEPSSAVLKSGALQHRTATKYLLDITFDHNRGNQLFDLTPHLPVQLHA